MQKTQHFIKVERTAEYYLLEPENQNVKSILFVLHGYAQLPKYFIEHFKDLTEKGYVVVAPSGLSLQYIAGAYGRVGASWMTKHNREKEIEDYVNYLEKLLKIIKAKFMGVDKISILGFSQGTATASRWFTYSRSNFESLILWAGGFAEDLNMELFREKLIHSKLLMVVGKNDKLIVPEKQEKQLQIIKTNGIDFELKEFIGGHEMDKQLLLEIIK